jgi:diguanylate cyclase (GGDEF)-like protein/PAS domain S-box-containing protein
MSKTPYINTDTPKSVKEAFGLKVFIPGIASLIFLTCLVGYSYYWNIKNVETSWKKLSLSEARLDWNKDAAFRKWASLHGGLYVKPDKRTRPNPYLSHVPNRDVTTLDGLKLTLINPAYMMRQMTNEFEDSYGVKGKITGKIVLNPINRADDWQKKALTKFETSSIEEFYEEQLIDGKSYLRYMKPMYMTKGCEKCHGHLGFKEGDLRGGVSVSIPLSKYLSNADETKTSISITHLVLWIVGIFVIAVVTSIVWFMLLRISNNVLALSISNTYYRDILETANDAIISIGEDCTISVFNQGAERLFGYSSDEAIGRNVSNLIAGNEGEQLVAYILSYLDATESRDINEVRETKALHKSGRVVPVRFVISDTSIVGAMRFTAIMSDLSDVYSARNKLLEHQSLLECTVKDRTAELEEANKKLKILSEIDPLTEVANRRAYQDNLITAVLYATRAEQPLSLLMIDIDYFKLYNDGYGHIEGDSVIQKVAEVISKMLPRATDFVARYGGEEFVVLMPNTNAQGSLLVAERVRKRIEALAITHEFSHHKWVTVSIGSATMQGSKINAIHLQKDADSALYSAKHAGRNCSKALEEKVQSD